MFLWWNLLNWFVIKENWWMCKLFDLKNKNNFLSLFRAVRIETHFQAHCFILSKSAQSCLAAAFGSLIIVNKEASSAKSFGFDWRFSVRLFKSRGSRIEPWNSSLPLKNANCSRFRNNKGDWNNSRSWKIFRWKIIGLHGINEVGGIFA